MYGVKDTDKSDYEALMSDMEQLQISITLLRGRIQTFNSLLPVNASNDEKFNLWINSPLYLEKLSILSMIETLDFPKQFSHIPCLYHFSLLERYKKLKTYAHYALQQSYEKF